MYDKTHSYDWTRWHSPDLLKISVKEYTPEGASKDSDNLSSIHMEASSHDVSPPYITYRLYKQRFLGMLGLVSVLHLL
jgi:hypothetical protein